MAALSRSLLFGTDRDKMEFSPESWMNEFEERNGRRVDSIFNSVEFPSLVYFIPFK